ncbi:hypothetical protein [uncultured Thiohalocapsa sp.]|uniref:hypothetical protein n=1 Tax=uncultured Thiohalocapsa sp. TaxID=768990 RepID=UPI0025D01540|nr:hypothetical protein [uncultured Thiohalocapsa sp.]
MFIGSSPDNQFGGQVPASGGSKLRVATMRSAARRGELADCPLEMLIDCRRPPGTGMGQGKPYAYQLISPLGEYL